MLRARVLSLSRLYACVLILLGLHTTPAIAQAFRIRLNSPSETSLRLKSLALKRKFSPLHIPLYIKGSGNVSIFLGQMKVSSESKEEAQYFFEGSIEHRGRARATEFTSAELRVFKGSWEFNAKFTIFSSQGIRYYVLLRVDSAGNHRFIRAPSYLLRKRCGASHQQVEEVSQRTRSFKRTAVAGIAPAVTRVLRELELAIEYDDQYSRRSDRNTRADIASLLHSVDFIFRDQFGISLVVTKQVLSRYPRGLTDADQLLTRFVSRGNRSRHLGRADAYLHLTGKDLDSGTIGLAYLGVMCSRPEVSYAIVQKLNEAVDHVVVSHELAHLFGARHDQEVGCGATPGVMSSFLFLPAPTFFSECSRSTVFSHIESFGSCLAPILPAAQEPRLRGEVSAKRLRGTVEVPIASPSCQIELRAATTPRRLRSGIVLRTFPASPLPQDFEVRLPGQTKRREPSRTVFIGAVTSCGSQMLSSPSRNSIRVRVPHDERGKHVSLKRWYDRLARNFQIMR